MFPDLTRDDVFRLETRRLWLRWPCQADAQALVRLAGDKAVAEMTARIPHPYPPGLAEQVILSTRRANAAGEGLTLAITPKARPGALIGMVGIEAGPEDGGPELGIWLGSAFWGQGFATEAVRMLIDGFFAYTGHPELAASARVVNQASRRVLEKCGFAFSGSGLRAFPARGGVMPVDHFRLDRRAFDGLRAWGQRGPTARARPEEAQAATAH